MYIFFKLYCGCSSVSGVTALDSIQIEQLYIK